MMEAAIKNLSEYSQHFPNVRLNTANAWALYARRRWPENGIKMAMREWGLTEGRAKGLFSGNVTQTTIDQILDHKRGGFMLGLIILQIRMQTDLNDALEAERERLDHEHQQAAAVNRRAAEMARHLVARGPLAAERSSWMGGKRDSSLGNSED